MLPLLLACVSPDPERKPDPEPTDTGTCPEATVWDGAACVPERCGASPWPEGPDDAVYVLAGATDGDGSGERPLGTIADGLLAAGRRGTVLVGAGTYPEIVGLFDETDGLVLRGRCPELVVVDAQDQDPAYPAIYTQGGTARDWTVAGLSVTGGHYGGVWALDGTLTLDTVEVWGNELLGVAAGDDGGAALVGRDLHVHDNLALGREAGFGLYLTGRAQVDVTGGVIEANTAVNVVAHGAGTSVALTDLTIRGGLPGPAGSGVGLGVDEDAVCVGSGLTLDGNAGIGVQVGGGGVLTLTDSVVSGTLDLDGAGGLGIGVFEGGEAHLERVAVRDSAAAGVQVTDAIFDAVDLEVADVRAPDPWSTGIAVDLQRVAGSLTRVRVSDAEGGGLAVRGGTVEVDGFDVVGNGDRVAIARGVEVTEGAVVHLRDLALADLTEIGLGVYGSTVDVADATIEGTVSRDGVGGLGVLVDGGSALTLEDVSVVDNRMLGLLGEDPGTTVVLRGGTVGQTRSDSRLLFGRGVEVHDGATVDAEGTLVTANTEVGIYVSEGEASARLLDVTIEGTGPSAAYATGLGLVVQGSASASVEDTRIAGNTGPGLYSAFGGRVDVSGSTVSGNGFAGAVVWGGTLVATDTLFVDAVTDPSLGGGVGVFGVGEATLSAARIEGGALDGNPYAGFWAEGSGSWELVDVDVVGGEGVALGPAVVVHGNAVFATHGAAIQVTGGSLTESRTAVLLDDATATVDGAAFAGNLLDVRQQGCGSAAPVDAPGADTVDLCPAVEELVAPLEFRVVLSSVPPQ